MVSQTKESEMAGKTPQKNSPKKEGKTLKEKREAKKVKKAGK